MEITSKPRRLTVWPIAPISASLAQIDQVAITDGAQLGARHAALFHGRERGIEVGREFVGAWALR